MLKQFAEYNMQVCLGYKNTEFEISKMRFDEKWPFLGHPVHATCLLRKDETSETRNRPVSKHQKSGRMAGWQV